MPHLYATVAGSRFAEWPEALQRCHLPGMRAAGALKVETSRRMPARIYRKLMKLPGAGDTVPTGLSLIQERNCIRWERRFWALALSTFQHVQNGTLFERYGPFQMHLIPELDRGSVTYRSGGCTLFGFRLPRFFAARSLARLTPTEHGWHVSVTIEAPLTGWICRYEGEMTFL